MTKKGETGMKRTILTVILALVSLALFSCSPYRTGDMTNVMVIGGQTVKAELYTYVFYKNRDQYFGADRTVSSLTAEEREKLDAAVEWELRRYTAVYDEAEKYGVTLTGEDDARAADNMTAVRNEYGDDELYYAELEKRHMSENVFYEQCRNLVLDDKLYKARADAIRESLTPDKLRADIDEYCYAAVQILWTGKDAAKTLGRIAASIDTAEKFYEAVSKYSVDTVRGVRICIVGEMLSPFEKAALALAPGEISPVVESAEGAHIIMRVPLTDAMIESELENLRQKDVVRIYRAELEEAAREAKAEYLKGFKGLNLA